MRLRAPRLIAISCLGAIALSGCDSVYLHDDGLQKQTDSALSTYKAADIPTAIKAKIALQRQTDQAQLTAILNQENAQREYELAELLDDSGRGEGAAVNRLAAKIENRLALLVGTHVTVTQDDLTDYQTKLAVFQSGITQDLAHVATQLSAYEAAGGTGLTGCPSVSFTPPAGLTDKALAKLGSIRDLCSAADIDKAQSDKLNDRIFSTQLGGLLAQVHGRVTIIDTLISSDEAAAKEQANLLTTTKNALDAASKSTQPIDKTVQDRLDDLNNALKAADSAAGAVGDANYKPSTALATIKFRETTLCDVIEASAGKSCSGGTPSNTASAANKAIGSLAAGFYDLFKATSTDPTPGALAIALAFQTGREAQAQAALASEKNLQHLLRVEQSALIGELEQLLMARADLQVAHSGLSAAICQGSDLGTVLLTKDCQGTNMLVRNRLIHALVSYNLSWAKGRTAARLDDMQTYQQDYIGKMNIALAKATARDGIITTTLQAIDDYGQGGVPPQTIASFLQAAGVAAVAKGVN